MFAGVELAREDLSRQRVPAHDRRRQRQPAEDRRPAIGRQAHERDRGAEHGAVGEQPVRVLPADVGLHRPHDRQPAQGGEREQQPQRPQPVLRSFHERSRGGREHDGHRHRQPRGERQHDLGRGHRFEVEPAFGQERDQARDPSGQQRRPPQRVERSIRRRASPSSRFPDALGGVTTSGGAEPRAGRCSVGTADMPD